MDRQHWPLAFAGQSEGTMQDAWMQRHCEDQVLKMQTLPLHHQWEELLWRLSYRKSCWKAWGFCPEDETDVDMNCIWIFVDDLSIQYKLWFFIKKLVSVCVFFKAGFTVAQYDISCIKASPGLNWVLYENSPFKVQFNPGLGKNPYLGKHSLVLSTF